MAVKKTIAFVADTHLGAMPPEHIEAALDAVLFPWLESNHFDMLVHGGDLFHKLLPLDSRDSKLAFRLVTRLAKLCHLRGVPFRLLKGTMSHDYTQLENFRPLEAEFPGFRLVLGTAAEEVAGLKVLWMPEVYPEHYGDHYSQFLYDGDLDVTYDAIFGHGEIDVATGWSKVIEGERHYGGTPTHEAERLLHHSSGPVWFGHVHKPFRYKTRLGFVGSFDRWCHGEEDPKGFDVITMAPLKKGGWKVAAEKVANTLAPEYRTVGAEEILDGTESPDEIVAKIREEAAPYHRLRVKFSAHPMGVEEYSIVRGALVEDRNVELHAPARRAEAPAEEAEADQSALAEAAAARLERISYLRDESVPVPERLHRYIVENSDDPAALTLTPEEVAALTAPLT